MNAGRAMKRFRLLRGMTQAELADACALSASHISQLERGGRNMSIKTFYKVARALGVHPVYLMYLASEDKDRLPREVIRILSTAVLAAASSPDKEK